MTFKVKDLMVSVIGQGGAALPADDTTPVPTPITPIAITAALLEFTPQLVLTAPLVTDALTIKDVANNPKAEAIGRAALGAVDGSAAFAALNRELVATAVGAAVIQHGGSAGMPDPNCGGTSLETIPTPITPYVHKAATVLQAEHLPRLKARLTHMLNAVEAAERTLTPRGKAAADLKERMKAALAEIETGQAAGA